LKALLGEWWWNLRSYDTPDQDPALHKTWNLCVGKNFVVNKANPKF
jgi:hypothetical protein